MARPARGTRIARKQIGAVTGAPRSENQTISALAQHDSRSRSGKRLKYVRLNPELAGVVFVLQESHVPLCTKPPSGCDDWAQSSSLSTAESDERSRCIPKRPRYPFDGSLVNSLKVLGGRKRR
jgi:hypothetical protein